MSGLKVQTTAKPLNAREVKIPSPMRRHPFLKGEDTLVELKEQLSRYAKNQQRKMALKAMKLCSYLQHMPLHSTYPEDLDVDDIEWKELEHQVCCSRLQINGIVIGEGTATASRTEVCRILQKVCTKLAANCTDMSTHTLYHALIVRLAGKASLVDSYLRLKGCLATPQVVSLQAPKEISNTMQTITVTVFESDSTIHATFTHYHDFGLHRLCEDSDSSNTNNNKPWIKFSATVYERVNLSTGDAVRKMELLLPRK
jgi:hypothetical protein